MTSLADLITGLSGGLLSPWGLPASPTRLATLLSSLAEAGGAPVNESKLARLLDTSRPTICRWMEGLEQAGILRRLPRLPGKNGARRTVQAPAWHIRDSGLIHALVGISSSADLRITPRLAAASWRSYVLEQTVAVMPGGAEPASYLSADGACIDLVLSKGDRVVAAATRIHLPVAAGRGTTLGAEATGATDRFMVVPDGTPRNTDGGFRIIGLAGFLDEVSKLYDRD
jgi:predicted AAA+ superfamily ATPase